MKENILNNVFNGGINDGIELTVGEYPERKEHQELSYEISEDALETLYMCSECRHVSDNTDPCLFCASDDKVLLYEPK